MSKRTQRKVLVEGQVCYGKAEALAFKALLRKGRRLAAPRLAARAAEEEQVARVMKRFGVTSTLRE